MSSVPVFYFWSKLTHPQRGLSARAELIVRNSFGFGRRDGSRQVNTRHSLTCIHTAYIVTHALNAIAQCRRKPKWGPRTTTMGSQFSCDLFYSLPYRTTTVIHLQCTRPEIFWIRNMRPLSIREAPRPGGTEVFPPASCECWACLPSVSTNYQWNKFARTAGAGGPKKFLKQGPTGKSPGFPVGQSATGHLPQRDAVIDYNNICSWIKSNSSWYATTSCETCTTLLF